MNKSNPTGDTFRNLLRQAGYKATPARLAILTFLASTNKPVSVPHILQKLKKKNIDSVTAYRTLDVLKKSNIVRQIDFQHDQAYYELADVAEHHHAICTRCDRVEDITNCCVENAENVALQQSQFATIFTHSLEFFGLCKQCALENN